MREIVKIARQILVGNDQFAGLVQAEERRVGFDGQLIKRKMFCGLTAMARLRVPRRPGIECLPRPGVDQIERVAIEDRAGDRNRVERFLRRVQASELLQHGIVERLHAQRNAVDTGGAIAAEPRRFYARGIGLERDFDVWRDRPVLADTI